MATTAKKNTEYRTNVRRFLGKVVINAGVGRASQQGNFADKILPQIMSDFAAIAGQQPHIRKAKQSIAGFKIREGQIVGVRVTLRGGKMVDFFERFITITLPRVRDFGGINRHNIDTNGNLNYGIKEQYVFTEVSPENSPFTFSLQVTLVPKSGQGGTAIDKYLELGVPLKKS